MALAKKLATVGVGKQALYKLSKTDPKTGWAGPRPSSNLGMLSVVSGPARLAGVQASTLVLQVSGVNYLQLP